MPPHHADKPGEIAVLGAGSWGSALAWLRENVHQHGRTYPPAELVTRATGRPLDHAPFVRYVTAKFGEIYGV